MAKGALVRLSVRGWPRRPKLEDTYIPSQDSTSFAFPPFSPPTSPMTIKKRVFMAITEGKFELGLGLGLG